MNAAVTVLERENRVLARVTDPVLSEYYQKLHSDHGVRIKTDKEVISVLESDSHIEVKCSDSSTFRTDLIIVGAGIRVNSELASDAGLKTDNGILVDESTRTSDKHIYAIGDCANHFNTFYNRYIRLESVSNANEQAKTSAAAICGKGIRQVGLPWFWSDQYDVKLQIAGLSEGYNESIVRYEESDDGRFSVWYFRDEQLLAVDAFNHMKAYVTGTKFIKSGARIDKTKLRDPRSELHPKELIAE
jgi:3-phenylpropionate/trans-cinnamate dioxygenase ferredoxin reductase subunit